MEVKDLRKIDNIAPNVKSEEIESYNRRESLKIYGLEYKEGETNAQLEHKIVETCGNELGVDVKNSDISVCHRLAKKEAR